MYSLTRPAITATEAYTLAVSAIKMQRSRQPYLDATASVVAKCVQFDSLAERGAFHLSIARDFDVDGLESEDMVALYDNQFTNRVKTATLRNSIKNAAPNARCPYCGQGYVSELDHYLPKTAFAATSVHPANLDPCCRDCNFAKRAYVPGNDAPALLHPCFDDDVVQIPWLSATLERGAASIPKVTFRVQLREPNGPLLARLERHMEVFRLQDRFAAWSAQALSDFAIFLSTESGRSLTREQAERYLHQNAVILSGGRTNSWEHAAYSAMADSDWYLRDHLGLDLAAHRTSSNEP